MTRDEILRNVATQLFGPADVPEREGLDRGQRNAVCRAVSCLRQFGCVLFADGVGSGKTRTAVVVADIVTRAPKRGSIWICAPTRVRDLWLKEARELAPTLRIRFVSHHDLSFGKLPDDVPELIVVDEAHRFVRASNRRRSLEQFRAIPKVLVTATPVVNRAGELFALLSLAVDADDMRRIAGIDFHSRMSDEDLCALLALVTIRSRSPNRPDLQFEEHRYDMTAKELEIWTDIGLLFSAMSWVALDAWPRHLAVDHFRRRYEWGIDALRESTAELWRYFEQWLVAARRGRRIPKRLFKTLFPTNQQPFDFLYPELPAPLDKEIDAVARDRDLIASFCSDLGGCVDSRFVEVDTVVDSCQKALVFCSQIAVAESLFRFLKARHRVALITGQTATMSGIGKASGRRVFDCFASDGNARVDVLVATDCLSEGVSLGHCRDVILVDTPQTPLVVEQRIGRIVRRDATHRSVRAHLFRPNNWNQTLGLRTKVVRKRATAASLGFSYEFGVERSPSALEAITQLDRFRGRSQPPEPHLFASSDFDGWLVVGKLVCDECEIPVAWSFDDRTARHAPWADLLSAAQWRVCAPFEIPDSIREHIRGEVDRRTSCRLVPQRVGIEDPAAKIWRRIADDADETTRVKLFGFQPRWVRAKLSDLVHEPLDSLKRALQRLPTPIVATQFEWRPVLWVRPKAH